MIWGIVSLILLLIIIGLTIWLLVRSNYKCPTKSGLNQSCTTTTDCNSGLVCSAPSGVTGAVGNVCKVAFGGVCSSTSECASGQTCVNGICTINLGTGGQACPCAVGYTCINNVCRAIVGQPCSTGSQCATGLCVNSVCVAPDCGPTGSNCSSYNTNCSSSSRTDCSTDCSTSSKTDCSKSSDCSTSSKTWSKHSRSSSDSSEFFKCDETDCTATKYSLSEDCKKKKKYSDSGCESYSECDKKKKCDKTSDSYSKCDKTSDSYSECDKKKKCNKSSDSYSSTDCSSYNYLKKGVYSTNQSNVDKTLFSGVDHAIIDIVQQNGTNFYLLLDNGNIMSAVGITTTSINTNKKMFRMIRFGSEFVGIDKKGKLYTRATTSSNTYWIWEPLSSFPKDAIFINSTNTYQNMEVLTLCGKAYLFTYSASWKNGQATSVRKQKDFRYYGQDLTRYIDIDERTNKGKTNDGTKYRHIKAAGFYNKLLGQTTGGGEIVQVLTDDKFTHVRVINNTAYFLFEQNC